MTRKHFFWFLLLVASTIAAFVSLLTTTFGLERYISSTLAWPLSLAVQVGLFGMAWLLGASESKLRGLVLFLYAITMPFSVVFSYVTLQSEFTENIRPQEAKRALFDDLRKRVSEVGAMFNQGINGSEEIALRLESWLEMERTSGWATQTCEEADHCYLKEVCRRIRQRIAAWEREFRQPYREGPGEKLIFGLLSTEKEAVDSLRGRLVGFRDLWINDSGILAEDIDNRERLTRYDTAITSAPTDDLKAITCQEAITLPSAPPYEVYARDEVVQEEQPVYAFDDFVRMFDKDYEVSRRDYPTLFALGLSLFMDMFVLIVALGATLIERREKGELEYPLNSFPHDWGRRFNQDIGRWVEGALLGTAGDHVQERDFLKRLIDNIHFDQDGQAVLLAKTDEQRRFGILLAHAGAAEPRAISGSNQAAAVFVLDDWVFPALSNYAATRKGG